MDERTVVVCPDCTNARVVDGRPTRIQCGRCGSSHSFESLKKFYRSNDPEAARRARAEVQAKVTGLTEEFKRASESGVIDSTVEAVIEDDDYLNRMGMDPAEIEAAGERVESSPSSESHTDIVLAAVREQTDPGREAVRQYADERGMDPDRAIEMLEKYRREGDVIGGHHGPFRHI